MRKLAAFAALLALSFTGSALAQTADEIILLAQKGVGEDVILAFVEASGSPITLSVADIVKLKDAKVPDKVVVAMLRRHPAARLAARPRSAQESQPEYPVTQRDDSGAENQGPVQYQPAVEAPATTYVYSGYPYSYSGGYYYPSYYPYYYSYYYPGVLLSFGFNHSFQHHYSNLHTGSFSHFPAHHFSNSHTGFNGGFGYGSSRPHNSVSAGGGGGFHGRR